MPVKNRDVSGVKRSMSRVIVKTLKLRFGATWVYVFQPNNKRAKACHIDKLAQSLCPKDAVEFCPWIASQLRVVRFSDSHCADCDGRTESE